MCPTGNDSHGHRKSWPKCRDGRCAENQREVYALEQIYLHNEPQRELVLQAVRVGDLGITAMPAEVFGITGLKIKAQSPLQPTFNMELANGADGYIPPPEQHKLGGYTTWPARTAAWKWMRSRRSSKRCCNCWNRSPGSRGARSQDAGGAYAQAVLGSKPAAYWRLHDLAGPQAADASGGNRMAAYQDGVAYYLEGPTGAGSAMRARPVEPLTSLVDDSWPKCRRWVRNIPGKAWVWNGLPCDARPMTGILFTRGTDKASGDQLAIGGTGRATGRLDFTSGDASNHLAGTSELAPKTWYHVAVVREALRSASISMETLRRKSLAKLAPNTESALDQFVVAGGGDGSSNFEGKISEIAVYSRALSGDEITRHYAAAVQN